MKIELFIFGKLKQPGFKLVSQNYLKMISKWAELIETELKPTALMDKSKTTFDICKKKDQEILSQSLLKKKIPLSNLILLDETGENLSSLEWAELFKNNTYFTNNTFYFALGSSGGFSDEIKKQSIKKIALGRQTLSHELARIVLYEQFFRALSIINHHPYHNEG